jgi:hypothetical protein
MPVHMYTPLMLHIAMPSCVHLQHQAHYTRQKDTIDLWQVDLVDFSGPIFEHVDNRFAALTLVQKGLCDAALFSPQGEQEPTPWPCHGCHGSPHPFVAQWTETPLAWCRVDAHSPRDAVSSAVLTAMPCCRCLLTAEVWLGWQRTCHWCTGSTPKP